LITKTSSQYGSSQVGLVRDSKESQLHKKTIRHIANAYEREGYEVKADHIDNFDYPESCIFMKPDIVAEKGEEVIVVEVETKSSVGTPRDKKQMKEFSKWAKESRNRDFRREIVT
jgi:Holliday junction resolvase